MPDLISHAHWDHTGDPSTFPPSTTLIVGPGTKSTFFPGWPMCPEAPVLTSAFADGEVDGKVYASLSDKSHHELHPNVGIIALQEFQNMTQEIDSILSGL